jgi:hypothetical protein
MSRRSPRRARLSGYRNRRNAASEKEKPGETSTGLSALLGEERRVGLAISGQKFSNAAFERLVGNNPLAFAKGDIFEGLADPILRHLHSICNLSNRQHFAAHEARHAPIRERIVRKDRRLRAELSRSSTLGQHPFNLHPNLLTHFLPLEPFPHRRRRTSCLTPPSIAALKPESTLRRRKPR